MKQQDFGKRLNYISRVMKYNIDRQISEYGVTGWQSHVLRYIGCTSKSRAVYQRDIEETFDIRRSSVTNVLQILEKNGYITRESVKDDARLKRLILTNKGQEICDNVYTKILEEEAKLLTVLTQEEITSFFSTLDKLSEAASRLENGEDS